MGWITSPSFALSLSCTCLLLSVYLYRVSHHNPRSRGCPLPPGPQPLPLVGNLFDIPNVLPWKKYRELCQKYGSIISFQAMGRTLIVIDDFEIAIDLMEKHSAVYSSRPRSPITRLLALDWTLALMPYNQEWRRHRKVLWQHFHPSVVHKFIPSQEKGARDLLLRLSRGSGEVKEHLRYTVGASMIHGMYGLEVAPTNDRVILAFEEGVKCVDLLLSGASILEYLPILGEIPTWVPGARLQRRLEHYRKVIASLRDMPWEEARAAVRTGKAPNSVAHTMIEGLSHLDEEAAATEDTVSRSVAAAGYTAGLDTQDSTLASFFVAMSLYPEVQKKAQAELEAVVGSGRLPKFEDRETLPYVDAVIKETMRWHTVAPLGVAHASSADEEYNGYFIPQDAIILVNNWSILHNPETYPQPDEFIPERYLKDGKLDPSAPDPAKVAFGFGRRICPGRYFAEGTLFLNIAYVLHTFDITPPVDEHGQPIHIRPEPTTGIISYIADCRCTIKPRSASAEELIRRGVSETTSAQ